jgi:hypothetical protein
VTAPVKVLTVATAVLLLLQVPPPEFVSVVTAPTQVAVEPLIADGNALTTTGAVTLQPEPESVYVTVGVPALTPVKIPVPIPMEA